MIPLRGLEIGTAIAYHLSGTRGGTVIRRIRILSFCTAAWALTAPAPALALPSQPVENAKGLCAAETARVERAERIPDHLLTAISLAESGRWDAARGEIFAWPWTINFGGEGRFFDTKAEAIAQVKSLQGLGVTSIDVGCMQVNLHYHPDAFADLDGAFDPATNVAYAASYLRSLHGTTRSWSKAAGAYHSMDPGRGGNYRLKVMRLWSASRAAPGAGSAGPAAADVGRRPTTLRPVAIDTARTTAFNTRLRASRAAARRLADKASHRQKELAHWREARVRGLNRNHLAAMRRAEARLERQQRRLGIFETDRAAAFAEKRRQQLRTWRNRRTRVAVHRR